MAIRIEFYELIVPIQTGKLYYPELGHTRNWNDGVICSPVGAMNTHDMVDIITDCENMGLSGLKEIDGEKKLVDFCIASQFGGPLLSAKCDWLRIYQGVAWNPEFPFGLYQPNEFPCEYGGFFYENKDVWEQSKVALLAFDEVLKEYEQKLTTHENEDVEVGSDGSFQFFMPLIPQKTPYDNFFIDLVHRTLEYDFFEKAPK